MKYFVQSTVREHDRRELRIASGGQTGVDRAALDAAVDSGLQGGGWCPKNRRAEDGELPARYLLKETPSERYGQRTEWNVRDTDATLILVRRLPLSGGPALTLEMASRHQKPVLTCLLSDTDPETVLDWLLRQNIHILNVAGPRESSDPGIGDAARDFLRRVFLLFNESQHRSVQ
jgi:hypothetical protein